MNTSYGIPVPEKHEQEDQREAVRYVVLIESGGSAIARLFLKDRTQVAEFSAAAEEVAMMTKGLVPQRDAADAAWNEALAGHSPEDRRAAEVFTLDV